MKAIKKVFPYLYLAPALVLVLIIEWIPTVRTFQFSFVKWDFIGSPRWVEFLNYIQLVEDQQFIRSFINTIYYLAGSWIIGIGGALYIALILTYVIRSKTFKWMAGIAFFIPVTLSPTAIGMMWRLMYTSEPGVINSLLEAGGLKHLTRSWLWIGSPFNSFLMVACWLWWIVSFNVIIYVVGVQQLPTDCIDAAKIDGGNFRQIAYYVIIPLLRPISLLVMATTTINTARVFAIPWVITAGGPARTTETLAVMMYREAFRFYRGGYGATIAVVITILALAVSWHYLRAVSYER